jgi:hypothetical protein
MPIAGPLHKRFAQVTHVEAKGKRSYDAVIRFSMAGPRVTRRVEPEGELADVRKQLVVTARWVRELEEWCKQQPGRAPNFSEAVRRIVEERIAADRARKP